MRVTPSTVLAALALFFALGGSAIAVRDAVRPQARCAPGAVRGYIVVFGYDSEGDVLKRRNYLDARDALMQRLETEGSSILQLPTQPPQLVVCTRYRMSEEDRFGGF